MTADVTYDEDEDSVFLEFEYARFKLQPEEVESIGKKLISKASLSQEPSGN